MAQNQNKHRRSNAYWELYPRNLYLIHKVKASEEEGTRVELLAECTVPGRLTGHYRWAFGGGNIEASCTIGSILDVGEVFWLDFNCSPHDIDIRENNCAGHWEDLADWIAKDRIGAHRDNEDDAKHALLGKLKKNISYSNVQNSKKKVEI